MTKEELMNQETEPWKELGISRRTYFRQKDDLGEMVESPESFQAGCPKHPNAKNDITREQMKKLIDKGNGAVGGNLPFIPNWYRNGFHCREDGIANAIKEVNARIGRGVRK